VSVPKAKRRQSGLEGGAEEGEEEGGGAGGVDTGAGYPAVARGPRATRAAMEHNHG
jgi:hypothetical protein